jgi:hypothetical protein
LGTKITKIWEQNGNKKLKNVGTKIKKIREQNPGTKFSKNREQKLQKSGNKS